MPDYLEDVSLAADRYLEAKALADRARSERDRFIISALQSKAYNLSQIAHAARVSHEAIRNIRDRRK